jgi:hypothetical protein
MDNRSEPAKTTGDRMDHEGEKNYLKNAELDVEGEETGYDMIDGIINNVPSIKDLRDYGYKWEGMAPLDRQSALTLFDAGHEVYMLYEDNTEGAASSREEIEAFDGLFGIEADKPSVIQSIAAMKNDAGRATITAERDVPKIPAGDLERGL